VRIRSSVSSVHQVFSGSCAKFELVLLPISSSEFRHYNYVMNYDCGHLLWEELTVAYVVFWTSEVPETHTPFCDEIVSKLKLLDTLKANHHY